jgi:hypothetical protein
MSSIKTNFIKQQGFYERKDCIRINTSYVAFIEDNYIKNSKGDKILLNYSSNNYIDPIEFFHTYESIKTNDVMFESDIILTKDIILLIGNSLYDILGREIFLYEKVEEVIEEQTEEVVEEVPEEVITYYTPEVVEEVEVVDFECSILDPFNDNSGIIFANFKDDGTDLSNNYNFNSYSVIFTGSEVQLYKLPNIESYLQCQSKIKIKSDFSFSVCAIITDYNTTQSIFSFASTEYMNHLLLVKKDSGLELYYKNEIYTSKYELINDVWYNFSLRISDENLTLRINGQDIISLTKTLDYDIDTTLVLGQDQDTLGGGFVDVESFLGNYKNLRLFDRFLEDSEVDNIKDCDLA